MLALRNERGAAQLVAVEDPQDVVRRLGQVDLDDGELRQLLVALGHDRLQALAAQINGALKESEPKKPESRSKGFFERIFSLPSEFGD